MLAFGFWEVSQSNQRKKSLVFWFSLLDSLMFQTAKKVGEPGSAIPRMHLSSLDVNLPSCCLTAWQAPLLLEPAEHLCHCQGHCRASSLDQRLSFSTVSLMAAGSLVSFSVGAGSFIECAETDYVLLERKRFVA